MSRLPFALTENLPFIMASCGTSLAPTFTGQISRFNAPPFQAHAEGGGSERPVIFHRRWPAEHD